MLRDLINRLLELVSKLVMRNCSCICGEDLAVVTNELQDAIKKLEDWMSRVEQGGVAKRPS